MPENFKEFRADISSDHRYFDRFAVPPRRLILVYRSDLVRNLQHNRLVEMTPGRGRKALHAPETAASENGGRRLQGEIFRRPLTSYAENSRKQRKH